MKEGLIRIFSTPFAILSTMAIADVKASNHNAMFPVTEDKMRICDTQSVPPGYVVTARGQMSPGSRCGYWQSGFSPPKWKPHGE